MARIRHAGFEDEEPGAIGAHDLRILDPQVDFGMAVGAVAAVAGDCMGLHMNNFGRGFARHAVHLSRLAGWGSRG